MNARSQGPYSSILQIAVVAFLISVAFVVATTIFHPLAKGHHLYAAHIGLAIIALYIFNRVLAFSQHSTVRRRGDRDFVVWPLQAACIVLIPCILNLLHRTEPFWLNEHGVMLGRALMLICLAVLVICLILMIFTAPVSTRGTFSEYVTLPLTVLSLVVVLGSRPLFGYLTNIVPDNVADLNLTVRNVVAAILAMTLFLDFLRLWFSRGQEFSAIVKYFQEWVPRRSNGEVIDFKTGHVSTLDAVRLIIFSIIKYPLMVVSIIGRFLIVLVESLLRSIRGLFLTRRFLLGIIFSGLIMTTLIIEHQSPEYLSLLIGSVYTNYENIPVIVVSLIYAMWLAIIIFFYAGLCYSHSDGLLSSWLLVFSLFVCGLWLGSLVLHAAVSLQWLAAPGFAFSWANPFFWSIALLGILGLAVGGRRVWGGMQEESGR